MTRELLIGNHAASVAAKLARVDVISAYPITPQTQIVERLSEFVDSGEMVAKIIRVESEHSAMAACVGAASVGARTFTATSAHGLVYMNEMVFWAGYARLPIVMAVVCRTLGPPWNIWNEHTDMLAQRDTGWIQFWAKNNQEILDSVIQAYKIAEDERVMLPVMVGLDGFILSHTAEPVDIPDQELVDSFLPPRRTKFFELNVEDPITFGSVTFPDAVMEFRHALQEAIERSKPVIKEVDEEWGRLTGRKWGGLIDCYRCEDAEVGILAIGSLAGDAEEAVDELREKRGVRAGVVRLRVTRPFPEEDLVSIASRLKALAIVDRNLSPGLQGILRCEVRSALYDAPKKTPVIGFISGLGGRDITTEDLVYMAEKALELAERGEPPGTLWLLPKR